jgi:hypothetical protein
VDARYFLECQSERVLRSPESYEALCRDSPPSQPYTDPKLKFNLKVCRNFVRRLCVIGFWHFTVNPKEVAGVFFVWKSNRTKIRVIATARRGKRHFLERPGVSLSTAEGLSRIEVALRDHLRLHSEEARRLLEDTVARRGLADVQDCFHRLRSPKWLAEYCALPPVPAMAVGLAGATGEECWARRNLSGHIPAPCAWDSHGACSSRNA